MIKKLAWREPTRGAVPRGLPGDLVPDKYKVAKDGSLIEIKGPKFAEEPNWTDIEVGREFTVDAHSALLWMTGQDVPLPKTVNQTKDTVTLRFPGDFTPALNRVDLEQAITNYRLLSGHFESLAAVVRRQSKEIEAIEELVLALAQQNNKALKEQPGLSWALSTLQIRSQIRR